jgi:hypothetical protein
MPSAIQLGQWLAGKLGRTVLAYDGQVLRVSRGALFAPVAAGRGWRPLGAGQGAAPGSRRFPAPQWATDVLEQPAALSGTADMEPLPGGTWIRPPAAGTAAGMIDPHRRWLTSWLAWRDDQVYAVLGYPGAPPVAMADVGRFWHMLSSRTRAMVRFVAYGPVAVPAGRPLGQELADRLGGPVGVCTGIPWSGQATSDVVRTQVLREDGTPGWRPYATQLGYRPAGQAGAAPPPTVLGHRPPVPGLAEVSPGVYAYERGAVVEVVQSGLWLRRDPEPQAGPPAPAGSRGVSLARFHSLVPGQPLIFVDRVLARGESADGVPGADAAEELVSRLDDEDRKLCRLVETGSGKDPGETAAGTGAAGVGGDPGEEPTEDRAPLQVPEAVQPPGGMFEDIFLPEPEPEPEPAAAPVTASPPAILFESGLVQAPLRPAGAVVPASGPAGLVPAEPVLAAPEPPAQAQVPASLTIAGGGDTPRVQPVPGPEASLIPPPEGIARERAWVRRALSRQYDPAAGAVGRVLAENPGIRGDDATSAADRLTDLVAVRTYLFDHAGGLDAALRSGRPGPHVPFGRCAAAGLRRLPAYRGAARLSVTLAEPDFQWYQSRDVVTDWAFCAAVTSGRVRLPGNAEFRIWSMTARRTGLLDARLPSQVLFLPGTRFKVLRVGDGKRRQVLLRELSSSEVTAAGQAGPGRVPLDEIAMRGLERAAAAWHEAGAAEDLPAGHGSRFNNAPGLIAVAAEREAGHMTRPAGSEASGRAAAAR